MCPTSDPVRLLTLLLATTTTTTMAILLLCLLTLPASAVSVTDVEMAAFQVPRTEELSETHLENNAMTIREVKKWNE